MAFQLVKIPCILLATAGIHVSNSPPNPRPSVENGAIIRTLRERLLRTAATLAQAYMLSLWLAAFSESAVIIAKTFPSLSISKAILKSMLFGRSGNHIRLTNASVLALFLSLLGARIRTCCYSELGKSFTFELSIRKEHELVTTGLYSIVRHPSYTGYLLNTIAVSLLHGGRGSWVRESGLLRSSAGKISIGFLTSITWVVCLSLLRRMGEEDRELKKRFGARWDDWAGQVPYNLIPGII